MENCLINGELIEFYENDLERGAARPGPPRKNIKNTQEMGKPQNKITEIGKSKSCGVHRRPQNTLRGGVFPHP